MMRRGRRKVSERHIGSSEIAQYLRIPTQRIRYFLAIFCSTTFCRENFLSRHAYDQIRIDLIQRMNSKFGEDHHLPRFSFHNGFKHRKTSTFYGVADWTLS